MTDGHASSPDKDDGLSGSHTAKITVLFVLCGSALLYFADDLLITVEQRLAPAALVGAGGSHYEAAFTLRIAICDFIAPIALAAGFWFGLSAWGRMPWPRLGALLIALNMLFFAITLVLLDVVDIVLRRLAPTQYLASLEQGGHVSVTHALLELPAGAVYIVLLCLLNSALSLVFVARFASWRLLRHVPATQSVGAAFLRCYVATSALMLAAYIVLPNAVGFLVLGSPLRSVFARQYVAQEVIYTLSTFMLPVALLAGFASFMTWRRVPQSYRRKRDIAALGDDTVAFSATSLLGGDEA